MTDGVNNAGQIDPMTAAEAAYTLGIKVYTIGMGRPGQVPVPVVDAFGRERIVMQESTLDEETLAQIAEETGGRYYRAENTEGLRAVYDEINSLEKSQIEIETFANYKELVGWVLAPGLALLLARDVSAADDVSDGTVMSIAIVNVQLSMKRFCRRRCLTLASPTGTNG